MNTAIIFAAGSGMRLQPFSNKVHKSLIKFNGQPLIEHIIHKLLEVKDLEKIIIIVGDKSEEFLYLEEKFPKIKLIINQYYQTYNTAYSLMLVIEELKNASSLLIITGDVVITENLFLNPLPKNIMASLQRPANYTKSDWSYEVNERNEIRDLLRSDTENSYLAGEWSLLDKVWLTAIYQELQDHSNIENLKSIFLGKFILQTAIKHQIAINPYIMDFDKQWDIDTQADLVRTEAYFAQIRDKIKN